MLGQSPPLIGAVKKLSALDLVSLWIVCNVVGRVAGTYWAQLLGRSGQQFGAVGVSICQQLGQLVGRRASVGWLLVWLLLLIAGEAMGYIPAENRVSPSKLYKPNPRQPRPICLTLNNMAPHRADRPPYVELCAVCPCTPQQKIFAKVKPCDMPSEQDL